MSFELIPSISENCMFSEFLSFFERPLRDQVFLLPVYLFSSKMRFCDQKRKALMILQEKNLNFKNGLSNVFTKNHCFTKKMLNVSDIENCSVAATAPISPFRA